MMLDHRNSYAFIDGTFTDCLLPFCHGIFCMLLLAAAEAAAVAVAAVVAVRVYVHSACGGAFLRISFVSAFM